MAAILGSSVKDADSRANLTEVLMTTLPLQESARPQVDELINGAAQNLPALGLIGGIALIWSASGMLGSVRGAMELAWEGHAGTRAFLHGKLIDALLLVIIVALIMSTFLAGTLFSVLPSRSLFMEGPPGLTHDVAAAVKSSSGVLISLTGSIVVLLFAYKFLPKPRPAIRFAMIGAVIGGILLELARWLFALYVDRVATYDVVYGSIGSIIAFLFFVYLAATVVLFGAEAGAAVRRVLNARRIVRSRIT